MKFKNSKKLIFFLPISVIFLAGGGFALNSLFGGGGSIPEDTMTRGLVGYWAFDEGEDETAYDASGYGNNSSPHQKIFYPDVDPEISSVDGRVGDISNTSDWSVIVGLAGDFAQDSFDGAGSVHAAMRPSVTTDKWEQLMRGIFTFDTSILADTANVRSWELGLYGASKADNGGVAPNYNIYTATTQSETSLAIGDFAGFGSVALSNNISYANWSTAGYNTFVGNDNSVINTTGATKLGLRDSSYDAPINTPTWWSGNSVTGVGAFNSEKGSGFQPKLVVNYNGVLFPTWAKGKIGGALSFNGVDRVQLPQDFMGAPSAATIETWVKMSSSPTSSAMVLSIEGAYAIYVKTDGTAYAIFDGASPGPTSVTNIVDGKWHQIVGTSDGSVTKIYIDGRLENFGAEAIYNLESISRTSAIGSQWDETDPLFRGLIDEARVYNRALSDAEVSYHFNKAGPIGHWKFDEGFGTTAYDSTGDNNSGTLYYMSTSTDGGWVSGKRGLALNFDGLDDYVSIPYSSTLDFSRVYKFTIEGWIMPKSTAVETAIIRSGKSLWNYLLYLQTDGKLKFQMLTTGGTTYTLTSRSAVSLNQYTHFAVARGPTDVYLYLNGVLDSSIPASAEKLRSSSPDGTSIGYNTSAGFFNGIIDDIRIYNYSRTAEEIQLDYSNNAGFAAKFGPLSTCDDDPGSCVTKNLVGYWNFEEGNGGQASDISGNGNNGTLTYMTTSSNAWTKGKVGSALQFDGADDYVTMSNSSSTQITDAITLSAWVYPRSNSNWLRIVGKDDGTNASSYVLGRHNNSVYFGLFKNSTQTYFDTAGDVPLNQWSYIAATWDGKIMRAFVNGSDTGVTAAFTGPLTVNNVSVAIGRSSGNGYFFDGLIDEIRIYNRALSAAEVRYHYNRGGPVARWKFDEGEGRTAYDSTDNNNDGTLVLAGSATSSAWVVGKYGGALSFDGVDDYVSGTISVTDPMTVSAWFKLDSAAAGSNTVWATDGANEHKLYWSGGALYYQQGGSSITFTSAVNTGQWYFVTAVLTDDTSGKIYLNGVLDKQYTLASMGTASNWKFGLEFVSPVDYFRGLIDDIRIYNYARTPEEIRLDYNAGFAALFGPQSSCEDDPGSCMTQGLAGYWSFEEGSGGISYDSSNYGNQGTTSGGPQWTSGKIGGGLSFDGVNDYVDVGNGSSLNITGAITLEAWVKMETVTANAPFVVARIGNGWATWDYGIFVDSIGGGNGRWGAHFSNGVNDWNQVVKNNSVIPGTWQHVVATYDDVSFASLYVDGVLVNTNTYAITMLSSPTDTTRIANNFGSYYLDGSVDEVRIYSRVLSAQEVRYHYNRGKPFAQWKMDEGLGTIVYDSTDNNNDGTMYWMSTSTGGGWTSGKYGSALSFDGGDDYVQIANFNTNNMVSASYWIYPVNLSGSQSVFSHSNLYQMIGVGGNANLATLFSDDTPRACSSPLTASTWSFVYIDFTNKQIYKNGVNCTTVYVIGWTHDPYTGLVIGNSGWYSAPDGLIDDIRIYNYTRTPSQIQQDYNTGLSAHFR